MFSCRGVLALNIVFSGVGRRPLLGWMIAIAATAWLLGSAAGDVERYERAAPDAAHTVLTSAAGSESAVNGDPAHLGWGSSPACPKVFATAVLPRLAPALVALGVLGALAAVAGFFAERGVQSGRGPPRGPAPVLILTGQDLLTRLCLSRR